MIRRQKNKKFELVSKFQPAGDQEQAIKKLTDGFEQGEKAQILGGSVCVQKDRGGTACGHGEVRY